MTPQEYDDLIERFRAARQKVKDDRAKRYESDTDVLSFFKESVSGTRLHPLEACVFMFNKHVTAFKRLVDQMAKDPDFRPTAPAGESDSLSVMTDLANYVELGYALLVEELQHRNPCDEENLARVAMKWADTPAQIHEQITKQDGILGETS